MKYLSSVTRITSGLYLLFASTSFLPSSWVAQAQVCTPTATNAVTLPLRIDHQSLTFFYFSLLFSFLHPPLFPISSMFLCARRTNLPLQHPVPSRLRQYSILSQLLLRISSVMVSASWVQPQPQLQPTQT